MRTVGSGSANCWSSSINIASDFINGALLLQGSLEGLLLGHSGKRHPVTYRRSVLRDIEFLKE